MALKAEKGEGRKLVPPGNYLGIVTRIYDLGTQTGGLYGPDHQMIVVFELHKRRGPVRDAEGRPVTISGFYSLRLGVKKPSPLRLLLEALTGRKIDEKSFGVDDSLLERACRLTIAHEDKGGTMRDVISAITPLDDDDDAPRTESDTFFYEIGPDRSIPDQVPDWAAKMVRRSKEFADGGGGSVEEPAPAPLAAGVASKGDSHNSDDDDPPF
jgi:hypothetical protein